MKKKAYIQPCIEEMQAQAEQMVAASINGNNGIGYGGTDVNGDLEPSTKEFAWDIWTE